MAWERNIRDRLSAAFRAGRDPHDGQAGGLWREELRQAARGDDRGRDLVVIADEAWGRAKLQRITAHECRHTCITWLDAAGVRPKVVSVLAGHALPRAQQEAAPITQQRYTHTLPGDLTRAGELFASYLAEATRDLHEAGSVPTTVP